ncbi:MAG: DUF3748 domain-containing protein [Bacteroidota bacterium]
MKRQNSSNTFLNMEEVQLTFEPYGHFLHTYSYFSKNDEWIVYDTRNEGDKIGETCCIEVVNVKTSEVKRIYTTSNQSKYGPGVGAVTFHPKKDQVLFIHGLRSARQSKPYGFSRRTGAVVNISSPGIIEHLDARDVTFPFTPGALRGGTHAHAWSSDGKWVSFTYNDEILANLEKSGQKVKDLRTVGVMGPFGPVSVKEDHDENNPGELFTVVVASVTESPTPGSDEIDRAYEEGWIGRDGYLINGKNQRALAFLGDAYTKSNQKITEVFLVDLPDDITRADSNKPLQGTNNTRPNCPAGTHQRRLTYTEDRKFPGVQGPRHWLKSLPDGSEILFLMKDNKSRVQLYGVSPVGKQVRQITHNDFSIETAFTIAPDGKYVAYGVGEEIYVTALSRGQTRRISPKTDGSHSGLQSIEWSNDGKMLAYNRKVKSGGKSYFQIFLLKQR